jgi:protein-S-isoprenylcysteine O-methyltransferase Ste14
MAQLITFRPPRIAMSLVLIAIAVHFLVPIPLHAAQPIAGIVLGMAGFLLMLRAWWLFRVAGTAICPTSKSTTLITIDVFAFSRNPMYLGITMMLAGLAMAMASASFYAAAFIYFVVIDRVFCVYEEEKALDEFGDEFLVYKRNTRRW